jgi:hypothetical protein
MLGFLHWMFYTKETEHMLLYGEAQIEETVAQFPQVALLRSVICVQLKADNSSWKLKLRCGCHFPCCALALSLLTIGMLVHDYQVSPFSLTWDSNM